MAISLKKNQKIELGFNKITVGSRWDPGEGTGQDFNLDALATIINSNRKLSMEYYFIC